MSAAVYLRVSSKSQKVASQKRAIRQYLDGHKIVIPEDRWFIDHGWSGKSLDRPGMDDLQRAVFMGDVDLIVVYSLDRLARNALEGMTLLADWLKRGVRLVVLTLQMDFSGDVGRMVASLLFHIAEMERNRIRARQAEGIAAAKDSCAQCSKPKHNVLMVDGRCPRCRGTEGRSWGGRRSGKFKVPPARARELAEKGLKQTEIAKALGVSTRTVIRMLAVA